MDLRIVRDNPFVVRSFRAESRKWQSYMWQAVQMVVLSVPVAVVCAVRDLIASHRILPGYLLAAGPLAMAVTGCLHFVMVVAVAGGRGAMVLAEERDKKTLEVLLTAPMHPREVVWKVAVYPFLRGCLCAVAGFPVYLACALLGGLTFSMIGAWMAVLVVASVPIQTIPLRYPQTSQRQFLVWARFGYALMAGNIVFQALVQLLVKYGTGEGLRRMADLPLQAFASTAFYSFGLAPAVPVIVLLVLACLANGERVAGHLAASPAGVQIGLPGNPWEWRRALRKLRRDQPVEARSFESRANQLSYAALATLTLAALGYGWRFLLPTGLLSRIFEVRTPTLQGDMEALLFAFVLASAFVGLLSSQTGARSTLGEWVRPPVLGITLGFVLYVAASTLARVPPWVVRSAFGVAVLSTLTTAVLLLASLSFVQHLAEERLGPGTQSSLWSSVSVAIVFLPILALMVDNPTWRAFSAVSPLVSVASLVPAVHQRISLIQTQPFHDLPPWWWGPMFQLPIAGAGAWYGRVLSRRGQVAERRPSHWLEPWTERFVAWLPERLDNPVFVRRVRTATRAGVWSGTGSLAPVAFLLTLAVAVWKPDWLALTALRGPWGSLFTGAGPLQLIVGGVFVVLVLVQLAAACLSAAGLSFDLLAGERSKGTLPALFITPLNTATIAIGKLAPCFLGSVVAFASGLPVIVLLLPLVPLAAWTLFPVALFLALSLSSFVAGVALLASTLARHGEAVATGVIAYSLFMPLSVVLASSGGSGGWGEVLKIVLPVGVGLLVIGCLATFLAVCRLERMRKRDVGMEGTVAN